MKKITARINFLKLGVLLFGVSLLLWNCEKEENKITLQKNGLSEVLQSEFNSEEFKKVLPYKYEVDWANPNKQYSKELKSLFYEFPIIYTDNFNPTTLNKQKKKGYYISFKIIVTEKEDKQFKFYVAKFYQKIDTKNPNLKSSIVTLNNSKGYVGVTNLFDKEGYMVFAKHIKRQEDINTKIFLGKEFRDTSVAYKIEEDCYTVTTFNYVDWYKVWDDENGHHQEYSSTQYIGYTTEEVCDYFGSGVDGAEGWLPRLDTSGGGGAGTYSSSGDGGVYNDCRGHGCRYMLTDGVLPDCEEGYVEDKFGDCVKEDNNFFNQNVWNTQDSYDDWNRLTDCEKDFFKSNLSAIYTAKENRKKAEEATSRLFPNCGLRNTKADAFRHSYFSALNTKSMGYTNASKLGDAHECDTPANLLNEKIMDLHNNSWGYNYSLSHLNLSETQFFQDFVIANNNGKIKTLENCN